MKVKISKKFKLEVAIRIPISPVGSIAHTKKKGKGSYNRKNKHPTREVSL